MKRSIFSRTASALVAALGVFVAAADVYAAELIQNGGFESPYLGLFNFTYPGHTSYPGNHPEALIYPYPTLDGWTYDNSALVNGQIGSDFYGPIPPVGFGGYQFAALQSISSLSQYFVSLGGELTLSWLNGGRPNLYGTEGGDQTYHVEAGWSHGRNLFDGQRSVLHARDIGADGRFGGFAQSHLPGLGDQGRDRLS